MFACVSIALGRNEFGLSCEARFSVRADNSARGLGTDAEFRTANRNQKSKLYRQKIFERRRMVLFRIPIEMDLCDGVYQKLWWLQFFTV